VIGQLFCAASGIDRTKPSGAVTSFPPRPAAVVGHAASPLAAAVAAGGMRALLPTINSNRPVPIVR